MSSSFHVPRRLSNVMLLLAALPLAAPIDAQAPAGKPEATKAVIALGESLFSDTRLSTTGTMSCATCHRPDRSFTEDKPEAVGQTGRGLGRNTPTLLGLASVNEFPVGGSFISPPKMVTLEERVVIPLREHAEMSGGVGEAVDRLAKDPACADTFNAAFEGPSEDREPAGVTGDRVAAALAAYVRSLRHKEGLTHFALAGSSVTLDPTVNRGLDLFKDAGRCQSCHSGPALTDGKLHVVSLLRLKMAQNAGVQVAAVAETRPEPPEGRHHRDHRGPGGGYGRSRSFERQTLTLLEVQRTAPYFRDGSAAALCDAIRQHVTDLREVGARREKILEDPRLLLVDRKLPARADATELLSASAKAQLASEEWIPPEFTGSQIDDLVAFLNSLTPMD